MRKRRPKVEKKYPVAGKDDLSGLPATPNRRAACETIRLQVEAQISNQLEKERVKAERLAQVKKEVTDFYDSVVSRIAALAKV